MRVADVKEQRSGKREISQHLPVNIDKGISYETYIGLDGPRLDKTLPQIVDSW